MPVTRSQKPAGRPTVQSSPLEEAPLLDSLPTNTLAFEPGPSEEDVTHMLSEEAYSFHVNTVPGITRYDGTRLPANSPCEDRFMHGRFPSPWNDGREWISWGIFDGHDGWETSELLKTKLMSFVRDSLARLNPPGRTNPISDVHVQSAISRGFEELDNSIIMSAVQATDSAEPLQDKIKKLAPCHAGSCALVSIYDPDRRMLHVACTGDSRAVFGRRDQNSEWKAIPLSTDQTGFNRSEVEMLQRVHTGENNMVRDGRLFGLMVTRSFGDSRWKWPLGLQVDVARRFCGRMPFSSFHNYLTPPYLTARPAVVTAAIDTDTPSFLIMASDGLWDLISNEQAVYIVAKWVDSKKTTTKNSTAIPKYAPFHFGNLTEGMVCQFMESRLTTRDENAAVHLIRNALGGNHHELIASRLAFRAPYCRHVRDDMTVQVIFFNMDI
ncbi:phosphatase 2C-like domain-containing protein [Nemania serpens]|nr:phosphatase 2C-like domain-containing protein [Nemania serpens]